MKFTRKAIAQWNGAANTGKGNITTDSTVLNKTQYSFKTRFENGVGTNPEELLAAAHAGCFTMQFSFLLDAAGHREKELSTETHVVFEDGTITKLNLVVNAKIENISESTFQEIAENAKKICPISKVLNAEITLTAVLQNVAVL